MAVLRISASDLGLKTVQLWALSLGGSCTKKRGFKNKHHVSSAKTLALPIPQTMCPVGEKITAMAAAPNMRRSMSFSLPPK